MSRTKEPAPRLMKRAIITILIVMILLLTIGMLLLYDSKIAHSQDELFTMVGSELDLAQGGSAKITYAGNFVQEDHALMWYIIQDNGFVSYKAVDCKLLSNDRYVIEEIYTPRVYAKDIVSILWKVEYLFLINNTDCKTIELKTQAGTIISKINILAEEYPYVYRHNPLSGGSKCSFLDSSGLEIRS